jgi:hypothetical protein
MKLLPNTLSDLLPHRLAHSVAGLTKQVSHGQRVQIEHFGTFDS